MIIEKGPVIIPRTTWFFRSVIEDKSIVYKKILDKAGWPWIVPVNHPEPALYIFKELDLFNRERKNLERYKFNLEDGTEVGFWDVWHCKDVELFASTGHDVIGHYKSHRIIALKTSMNTRCEVSYYNTTLNEVVYERDARDIRIVAQEHANSLNEKVHWMTKNVLETTSGVCTPKV